MTTGDTWPRQDTTPPTGDPEERSAEDPQAEQAEGAPTPPARRGAQPWVAAAAAVVGLALCVGVATLPSRTPPDPLQPASAPSLSEAGVPATPYAEVRDILARRTQALTAGDQVAFLADVDPSQTQFVARQKRLFTNLRKLPLTATEWTRSFDADRATKSLEQRYGAPVYQTWVTFTYQLKGYDRAPTAQAQGYTFVQRDGRWLLASDTDVEHTPQGAGPEIWDRSEIVVVKGTRSLVIGTPRDRSRLREIARVTDDAAARDHQLWRVTRMPKVVVYLPRDKESHKAYFSHGGQERFDGVEFAVTSQVPDWSDGDAGKDVGTRVVLNTGALKAPQRIFSALVRHEVAHVATAAWTGDGAPVWMVEGAAEYTAYRSDVYGRTFPNRVFADAAKGHLLTSLPTTRKFYDSSTSYDRAYLLFVYIRFTWGEEDIVKLYHLAGPVENAHKTKAKTAAAVRKVLGISEDELLRRFNAWAQSRVRPA